MVSPCTLRLVIGSSPRMRRTARYRRLPRMEARFIPAHAGNSRAWLPRTGSMSVHPRACGEQICSTSNRCAGCGSSPRMRGTACPRPGCWRSRRFIPAHAGNSYDEVVFDGEITVHPRACGEQASCRSLSESFNGSSPRMRGTVAPPAPTPARCRFIPAHAGNRSLRFGPRRAMPVHPRACGEQRRFQSPARPKIGSSPRMRGTGAATVSRAIRYRFIPAHAGNRMRSTGLPRSSTGSSPRMRGTAQSRAIREGLGRFIPAHAGNRPTRTPTISNSSVHPRACGEQVAGGS